MLYSAEHEIFPDHQKLKCQQLLAILTFMSRKNSILGLSEPELDVCVQRTLMPPPTALSKMAPWLRYWLLSDNYRSIKADLYNIEETNEGPC